MVGSLIGRVGSDGIAKAGKIGGMTTKLKLKTQPKLQRVAILSPMGQYILLKICQQTRCLVCWWR
jgi:hypothetical protein